MGVDDTNSSDERRAEAERELDAFNAEQSDTLAGYRGKHLPESPSTTRERSEKKAAEGKAKLSALQSLLASDPDYAALYNDTFNKLRDAEAATEAALISVRAALGMAKEEHADMLDRASTLPDGTKVFRDANGDVFTEEGEPVSADDAAAIIWREDSPSYEGYLKSRAAIDEAETRINDLEDYQVNVLGTARNRLEDEESPPSEDELKDINDEIDAGMHKIVGADHKGDIRHSPEETASVKLPPPGG